MEENQVTNQDPNQIPPRIEHTRGDPEGLAVASMVLGIIGAIGLFISCVPYIGWVMIIPFSIVDILAVIFGIINLKKVKRGEIVEVPNKGMAIAGLWCGLVPIILYILMLFLAILGFGGTLLGIMISEGSI